MQVDGLLHSDQASTASLPAENPPRHLVTKGLAATQNVVDGELSRGRIGAIHQYLHLHRTACIHLFGEVGRDDDHRLDQAAVEPVFDLVIILCLRAHDQVFAV